MPGTLLDDGDLASGDSVNSSAASGGSASGYEYGYGYVNGSVSKNSTGSTNIIVGGEATEDSSNYTESAGYYYASLSFTVDAYDSDSVEGGQGNSFGVGSSLSVYADTSASISASSGHSGSAGAYSNVSFSGYGIVSVTLP